MKHLIIILICLFTFNTYNSFGASNSGKTILKLYSNDALESNESNVNEFVQTTILNSNESFSQIEMFGWICFARLVDRRIEQGVDGNYYITEIYDISCFWYNPPQVGNVN